MRDTSYRAAVIGLGVMGNIADGLGGRHPVLYKPCCHTDMYELHPNTHLVAGCARSPERRSAFLQKFEGCRFYSDYQKMLKEESIEILSIATPATCHAEMVIAAAEAGVKGIYCEKAMAVSLVECDAMIAACEETGTILVINHQRRWDDRYRNLKKLIKDGIIGRLESVFFSIGGGRLCRSGSHFFDLALMFCDDEVSGGSGWLGNPREFDPEGFGIFESKMGMRITIDISHSLRHPVQGDLIGEEGMVRIASGEHALELWTRDEESEFGDMALRHLPRNFSIGNAMMNAIDDLIHCIEYGGQPLSSGYDGRRAFEMLTTIHQSHHENRAFLTLPLVDRGREIPSN